VIYVIVLNWNGGADTIACAESVLAQGSVPLRLVVCDNASTDDSLAQLRAWGRPLHELPNEAGAWRHSTIGEGEVALIQTGGNLGYAGGNNVGLRYALARGDAEFVWILNNDTTATPGALRALVAKARSDTGYGIVGSTLVYHYQPSRVQVLGGCRYSAWTTRIAPVGWGKTAAEASAADEHAIEAELDYVTGASMLVSRAFIGQIGLMQDDYFLYFEEIDWAERGRRSTGRKWKLGYARDSVVIHKVGASAGTGTSASATRYFYASKIRFMKRFYPARVPLTYVMVLLQAVKLALRGGFVNARVMLGVLGAAPRIVLAPAPGVAESQAP
jgi:GT2 family glycosyltransferase